MIDLSDEIRKAYDKSTIQYDKIKIGDKEFPISNVQYCDDCYDEGNIFGTAIARTLDFEIENIVDLEKKEFEYFTGIRVEDTVHYISLGKFITTDVEPGDTTLINKVSSMDYMLKANIQYETKLDYSSKKVTILDVLEEASSNAGLELATKEFANSDFIVDSNQFEVDAIIRQVFQAVAGISGTFAKIRSDNKLYFITPKLIDSKKYTVKEVHKMLVADLNKLKVRTITNDLKVLGIEKESTKQVDEMLVKSMNNIAVKRLTTNINEPSLEKQSDYTELVLKRNTHPINVVSIGMSQVEGENITLRDEESIAEDGENYLTINDNPFAYTQEKREQLIVALYEKVKGFSYTAYELKGQCKPYLETGDPIWVLDADGAITSSFLFRFTYKSPNGLESEMSAPSIIKSTVEYQNVPSDLERIRRTEIIVDKQQGTIDAIIDKQTEDGSKINSLQANADETTDTISKIIEDYQEQIAQLKLTIDGLTNTVSTKGGGNIFSYSKENWNESITEYTNTDLKQNSISGLGYELVIGTTKQEVQLKNGIYTISFLYKNINNLDNAKVIINGESFNLEYTNNKWKEFEKTINVTANTISISFVTDTNNAIYITDLMGNIGAEKQTWEQNANETYTDTVQIGKGIQVNSSETNTYTRIDSDGNRVFNKATGKVISEFTDKGMETQDMVVNGKAEIAGMLVQKVGSQTWLSSLL
ncbi:MAG: hypothetical protein ACLUT6_06510 [Clostridia bacterium]|jgi:hypothetical protein|nr:MAG TPA: hypothetical protein [Caudoviricetes sp.]